ncbi:noncanonical pyrimidine nucleotidase, YjjG family [Chitinophagaceae bacterium IBVUCB1]|nr:noncanonical pyrimidine nucleotidase, YjjG family [Chitinophagaceae bacterium IBVUCB1]
MPAYNHLFFDLDHTLWDFEANSAHTLMQVYEECQLASHGITDYDAFATTYHAHNEVLWARFRNGFIKRDELRWKRFWLTLIDFKIGDTHLAHEMSSAYLEILPTQRRLIPHAEELLAYCKQQGYTMHLITNGFESTQRQKLQVSGIAPYFTELITSERSNSVKPQAAIFQYALQATGATAEESIMIGDALEIDILGAFYAGWHQAYYNPARTPHRHKPTYEVASLEELMKIF